MIFTLYVFDYGAPIRADNPTAQVRFCDTGHFALETHAGEIAAAIADFLDPALKSKTDLAHQIR